MRRTVRAPKSALRVLHGAGPAAVADVMLAVLQDPGPTTTVRDVARTVGCSTSTAHEALILLDDEGLVSYLPGRQATIRPRVARVAWGPYHEPDPLRCLAMSVLEPTEPRDNGFVCNRVSTGHRFGSRFCPACAPRP